MPIFRPKPWVNPCEKMSIFRVFKLHVCYSQESRFFVVEYPKGFYLPCTSEKKELNKWQYFDQNHGLTPLEKCQFFDFMNFLFL